MKRIKFLIIFFLCVTLLKATNNLKDFVNVIPPSPNASSLAMYADYPVSYYTGIPQISIPLYEINIDGVQLPITLSYHASGTRVSQEASWVGLGWALNAGASISRTIRCYDDFNLWGSYSNGSTGVYKGYFDQTSTTFDDYYTNIYTQSCTGAIPDHILTSDSEPDAYYLNMPNYSTPFVISKAGNGIFFDTSKKMKLQFHRGIYAVDMTIIDTDGTEYIFNDQEITENYNGNNAFDYGQIDNDPSDLDSPNDLAKFTSLTSKYVSSWYLSKIITPRKREITFTYEKESYVNPTQESCINKNVSAYDLPTGYLNQNPHYTRSKSKYENVRLRKITWDEGFVEFIPSSREDMIGYNTEIFPKKLDRINILSKSGTSIKSFSLAYSYFNDQNWGKYNYLYKRLKLNSLQELDSKGVEVSKPYTFSYYEGTMPRKNSNNVDLWGYNNGKTYGQVYYPAYWIGSTKIYEGADRSSSFDDLKIGTLYNIHYPAGGYTNFEYELNEFPASPYAVTYHVTKGGGIRIKKISSIAKTRIFEYSNGNLIVTPTNIYDQTVNIDDCKGEGTLVNYNFNYIAQCSNSVKSLSSLKQGNSVGYDEVTESVIDGSQSLKTKYTYYNEAEEPNEAPNIPNTPILSNGLLKKIEYISPDNNGKTIEYTYQRDVVDNINQFFDDSQARLYLNYSYNVEWWKKVHQITTEVLHGQEIITDEYYKYNSSNYLLNETKENSSKNIPIIKINKFATDYTDTISMGMVAKNIIGLPIETYILKNGKVVNAQKTEYMNISGMYLPKIIYKTEINTPVLESNYTSFYLPFLFFDRYTSKGQPIQIREKNNMPIVYLWSYNYSYPIAEIKNATYEEVQTALQMDETEIGNLGLSLNPDIDEIRGKLLEYFNNSPVIFTTFSFSPLIGMVTTMDSKGVKRTYSYDDSNRLHFVLDNKNKKVQNFDYHYQ